MIKYLDPQYIDRMAVPDAMKLQFILAGMARNEGKQEVVVALQKECPLPEMDRDGFLSCSCKGVAGHAPWRCQRDGLYRDVCHPRCSLLHSHAAVVSALISPILIAHFSPKLIKGW